MKKVLISTMFGVFVALMLIGAAKAQTTPENWAPSPGIGYVYIGNGHYQIAVQIPETRPTFRINVWTCEWELADEYPTSPCGEEQTPMVSTDLRVTYDTDTESASDVFRTDSDGRLTLDRARPPGLWFDVTVTPVNSCGPSKTERFTTSQTAWATQIILRPCHNVYLPIVR